MSTETEMDRVEHQNHLEGAQQRAEAGFEKAQRLSAGRRILAAIETNLDMGRSSHPDLLLSYGDLKDVFRFPEVSRPDIADGTRDEQVEYLGLCIEAVEESISHEEGLARAAHQSADYDRSRLDNDAAAETAVPGVENS